jgi:hypothetical protein
LNRSLAVVFAAAVLAATAATPAFARVGLHAGLCLDPDDFLVGVHFESQPIEESLVLVPSIEAGFGDITMIAGNLDLHYNFKTQSKLAPFAGGGLTINWFDFDGGSSTDFGGSLLGGIQLSPSMFLEAKVGLGDVPDFKFFVGWHRP